MSVKTFEHRALAKPCADLYGLRPAALLDGCSLGRLGLIEAGGGVAVIGDVVVRERHRVREGAFGRR